MKKPLLYASAELARRAPQEWAKFIGELAKERDVVVAQCIASPISELPVHQGRARQMASIVDDLSNALNKVNEMERTKS